MKFKVKDDLTLTRDDVKKTPRLTEGAVYIKGDTVEVTEQEARQLLQVASEYFEPADAEAKALVKEG